MSSDPIFQEEKNTVVYCWLSILLITVDEQWSYFQKYCVILLTVYLINNSGWAMILYSRKYCAILLTVSFINNSGWPMILFSKDTVLKCWLSILLITVDELWSYIQENTVLYCWLSILLITADELWSSLFVLLLC